MTASLDLSARLDQLITNAHLTRRALALELGLHGSVIDLWCNGGRGVPDSRLEQLAAALEVGYYQLIEHAPAKVSRRDVYIPSSGRVRGPHPEVRVVGRSFEAGSLGGNPHGGPSPVPGRPRRT